MKAVIAFVGEPLSGKGTCAEVLEKIIKKEYPKISTGSVRFSAVLSEVLEVLSIPHKRENYQALAQILKETFGLFVFTDEVLRRVEALAPKTDIVFVDGVRWISDLKVPWSFPNHFVVYLTANQEVRFERAKKRKGYVGEESMSFEQFLKEGKEKTEQFISLIGEEAANLQIDNNGTPKELEKQLRCFYKEHILLLLV